MRRDLSYLLLSGLLLGACADAQALAVADLATSEDPPTDKGYSFNWDYVYNYKGASASAVDHYWILTAAHVADDGGTGSLIIDGETYLQQEVVLHSQISDPDNNPTADLALVRYDKLLPSYYLLGNSVPVGAETVVCGFGRPGDVVSTFFDAYFTEDGTDHSTKRWGTNKIDRETTTIYTGPSPLGTTTNKGFEISISKDRSNAEKTAYEAGCNVFDSGGGMFFNDGGVWKLVGHMTSRLDNGSNYTGNFAVATKYYVNWIKSVIIDYDTDMNGLPDWWEAEHGVTDPEGHDDSDSFTNYEEWLADTDPNDGNSFLEILDYSVETNLVFSSSTNRTYQVEHKDHLADAAAWQTNVSWFVGSHPQTEQPVSTSPSNRFYRVRAKLR